jgi:uncharacterized repeat protein (TIGR02543 family)
VEGKEHRTKDCLVSFLFPENLSYIRAETPILLRKGLTDMNQKRKRIMHRIAACVLAFGMAFTSLPTSSVSAASTVTITYNYNWNGNAHHSSGYATSVTATVGEEYPTFPDPVQYYEMTYHDDDDVSSYKVYDQFTGWYLNGTRIKQSDNVTKTSNHALNGSWTGIKETLSDPIRSYAVYFDHDNGTGTIDNMEIVWTLEGWYTDPDLTNRAGSAGDNYYPEEDTELYANWTDKEIELPSLQKEWTVSYIVPDDAEAEEGTFDDVTATSSTNAWYDVTGTSVGVPGGSYTVEENQTLYAGWDNESIVLPEVTVDGKALIGWYDRPQSDSLYINYGAIRIGGAGEKVEVDSDLTLYAWFNSQPYLTLQESNRTFYEGQTITGSDLLSLIDVADFESEETGSAPVVSILRIDYADGSYDSDVGAWTQVKTGTAQIGTFVVRFLVEDDGILNGDTIEGSVSQTIFDIPCYLVRNSAPSVKLSSAYVYADGDELTADAIRTELLDYVDEILDVEDTVDNLPWWTAAATNLQAHKLIRGITGIALDAAYVKDHPSATDLVDVITTPEGLMALKASDPDVYAAITYFYVEFDAYDQFGKYSSGVVSAAAARKGVSSQTGSQRLSDRQLLIIMSPIYDASDNKEDQSQYVSDETDLLASTYWGDEDYGNSYLSSVVTLKARVLKYVTASGVMVGTTRYRTIYTQDSTGNTVNLTVTDYSLYASLTDDEIAAIISGTATPDIYRKIWERATDEEKAQLAKDYPDIFGAAWDAYQKVKECEDAVNRAKENYEAALKNSLDPDYRKIWDDADDTTKQILADKYPDIFGLVDDLWEEYQKALEDLENAKKEYEDILNHLGESSSSEESEAQKKWNDASDEEKKALAETDPDTYGVLWNAYVDYQEKEEAYKDAEDAYQKALDKLSEEDRAKWENASDEEKKALAETDPDTFGEVYDAWVKKNEAEGERDKAKDKYLEELKKIGGDTDTGDTNKTDREKWDNSNDSGKESLAKEAPDTFGKVWDAYKEYMEKEKEYEKADDTYQDTRDDLDRTDREKWDNASDGEKETLAKEDPDTFGEIYDARTKKEEAEDERDKAEKDYVKERSELDGSTDSVDDFDGTDREKWDKASDEEKKTLAETDPDTYGSLLDDYEKYQEVQGALDAAKDTYKIDRENLTEEERKKWNDTPDDQKSNLAKEDPDTYGDIFSDWIEVKKDESDRDDARDKYRENRENLDGSARGEEGGLHKGSSTDPGQGSGESSDDTGSGSGPGSGSGDETGSTGGDTSGESTDTPLTNRERWERADEEGRKTLAITEPEIFTDVYNAWIEYLKAIEEYMDDLIEYKGKLNELSDELKYTWKAATDKEKAELADTYPDFFSDLYDAYIDQLQSGSNYEEKKEAYQIEVEKLDGTYSGSGSSSGSGTNADSYTIHLSGNKGDGSTDPVIPVSQVTVQKGETYEILPESAYRKGYTFAGWYTAESGGTLITRDTVCAGDIGDTLYAHWTANSYVVYFNTNGGTGTTSISLSTTSKQVTFDQAYGSLPTPSRSNYTFLGWYTRPVKGEEVTSSTIFTYGRNQTLYAQWSAKTILIVFNANKGSGSSDVKLPENKKIGYDETYGALADASRDGYTFLGWYTAASGGTKITGDERVTSVSSNIQVYAHWQVNTYTLHMNANRGTGSVAPLFSDGTSMVSKTVTYDSAIGTMETPYRSGYVFGGWNTRSDGSGMTYTSSSVYLIDGDLTLYAMWTQYGYMQSMAIGKTGLVYNGTQQNLIYPATGVIGGAAYYKVTNGTNANCAQTSYATTIPNGTNAGTYTITYYVKGNEEYVDSPTSTITVTIDKAQSKITAFPTEKIPTSGPYMVMDGSTAFITAGECTGGTLMYKLGESGSYSSSLPKPSSGGTYTVYYYVKGDSNHYDSAVYSITVTTCHVWNRTSYSAATCTSSGYQSYKCSVCGTTTSSTLPALGHSPTSYTHSETYSVAGSGGQVVGEPDTNNDFDSSNWKHQHTRVYSCGFTITTWNPGKTCSGGTTTITVTDTVCSRCGTIISGHSH